jgi:hypothetical protein
MGTTDTALATGSGRFGYVLLIEGFPYLITDSNDLAAVLTAYAASEWDAALPGLKVVGSVKQSIEPFKEDLDIPELVFHVMDCDGLDVFGKAVWKSKPSISTRLSSVFEPAANGSGTLTVKDNATGPAAFPSSGTLYLGTRAVAYSAKPTSSTFTVSAAGASTFSPFTADTGNTYSLPGSMAEGQNWDVAAPPWVTDIPKTWIGKKVALYIHRIVGGVWDTQAQAHLEFAGTIGSIEDGEGITVVKCRDLRKQIEDAVIHKSQWRGYVKPGIWLAAGTKLKASVSYSTSAGGAVATSSSGEFTVVASGASGDDECDEGLYDYPDFLARLEAWLSADSIGGQWSFYTKLREQGVRTSVRCVATAGMSVDYLKITLRCTSAAVLEFMGFGDQYEGNDEDDAWLTVSRRKDYTDTIIMTSNAPPYRVRALQAREAYGENQTLEMDAHDGVWWDHSSYLPSGIKGLAAGGNWSYVVIGESQLAIAEYSSDTELIDVTPIAGFGEVYDKISRDFIAPGVTYDDPADARLEVRQVVFLTGKFSEIVPRLLASIDGRGINHDDYDEFPSGAAVPWSLLGDDFVDSCKALETSEGADVISVRLDRPTRLKDLLIPEVALRFAFLVFKDGGYRFVSPPVPNSATADWTLDETNKAVGPGEKVPMTSCAWSSDHMHNVVKVNYRQTHDGKFIDHVTVKDATSIAMHGETEAIEIDAVNSVSDRASVSGSTVESLAANLSVRLFPMFSKPAKLITRTIAPSMYGICPGDTVSFSDNLIRDPTTGARGISSRACICLASFHDYGHEGGRLAGEVTLLMSDEERVYPLSPAAEVDTSYTSGSYVDGYDSTNYRLKLKSHSFSKSTDSVDTASFSDNDLVDIVELDPADPASIDSWSRTIDSVSTGSEYIQLTAALSSPSWSGATKKFVVIPQAYSAVQTSQKTKAFQADGSDGHILDTIEPNAYGTQTVTGYTNGVSTDLPALLADVSYGDGKPLTPYQLGYLVRGANNLVNYKTATHTPIASWRDDSPTYSEDMATDETEYQLHMVFPFYVGGFQVAGRTRYISVAPQFRSEGGATAYVRVTSSMFPPTGTSLSDPDWTFREPARSVEFTTTSTTLVTATAQDLLPVPAQIPGHTWLSISLKCTGGDVVRCSGLPVLYLKALA